MTTRQILIRCTAGCVLLVAGLADQVADQVGEAAKHQDAAAVKRLIAAHADVNAAQSDGATALHWAAQWDDTEMVDMLLRAGAKANAVNQLGVSALSLACTNGNAGVVAKLLNAGASATVPTATGETPLMSCARSGSAEAVKNLIAHEADGNAKENTQDQTALMWAAGERHPAVVKLLLEHHADVHARSRVTRQFVIRDENGGRLVCPAPPGVTARCTEAEMVDRGGSTALLFAARSGDVESAALLLSAGASVNEAAPDGNTVLVVAAYSGNTKLVKFLLDKDAPPNSAGAGYTALHMGVVRGDPEMVKALLSHGANVNARVAKGTPIMRQAQDYIIPNGFVGATPFFLAARFVEPEIAKALQAAGADARTRIEDGTTPLMAATGVGWKSGETRRIMAYAMTPPPDEDRAMAVVKVALEMGADVNEVNSLGETALHGTATEGYTDIAKLLLDKGAVLNARTKRGETPLALTSADLLGANGAFGVRDRRSTRALFQRLGGVEDPPRGAPPKNLLVIKDPAQVRPLMATFTAGLGVQCTYCHVDDRASDANPQKNVARRMIQMTADINAKFPGEAARVSCYTCHRGDTAPKLAQ